MEEPVIRSKLDLGLYPGPSFQRNYHKYMLMDGGRTQAIVPTLHASHPKLGHR